MKQGLTCWSRRNARLRVNINLYECFPPLFLGERNLAAIVIVDDDGVGAVVDFHGWATALNATESDTRDVCCGVVNFGHCSVSLLRFQGTLQSRTILSCLSIMINYYQLLSRVHQKLSPD